MKLFGTKRENKIYKFRMYNYEQVLRADELRTIGYQQDGEKVKVIYDKTFDEKAVYEIVTKPLQEQIFKKFVKICDADKKNYCKIEDVSMKKYVKMMKKTSKADFEWLFNSENTHFDSFARVGFAIKSHRPRMKFLLYRFVNNCFCIWNRKTLRE